MPCALPPTASRCGRLAGHPVPAPIQRAAAAPARAGSIACHAAAAPPAPRLAVDTERRQAAGGPLPSTSTSASTSIGTHTAPDSWLAYSCRLRSNPPGVTDIVLERLRRQLGWGGRWAWQWELEGESDDDYEEAELLSDADEAEAAASSSGRGSSSSRPQPIVRSSLGRGRRSGARRQCRGQALMGAGAYGMERPWREADALPAELQSCCAGRLLTAEQESWLGELVQAGRAAQQQQQAAPAGGASSSSGSAPLWRQRPSGPPEPLEHAMQRGAAAQQLLFDANLRLVPLAQRKLLGGGCLLPPQLIQELENAGRDALWRAAAGFQPGRRIRFSSYAVPAILNTMRTVLRHSGEAGVHVPGTVHPWEARVRSAAHSMQLVQQQRQALGEQGAAEQRSQPQPQPTSAAEQRQQRRQQLQQRPVDRRRSRPPQQPQPGSTPLEQLAAAAQLTPRQVLLGLAAGRRQRLASFGCLVVAEALEGAGGRKSNRADQLARFGDLPQQEQLEQDEAELASTAAQEAVQLLLCHLPASRHAEVLRLRHRLDDACCTAAGCGAGEQQELDFTSVGRQLGVSRQRAQVLYRAAVDAARQQAAALGIC